MSRLELWLFRKLLLRFWETEVDQWARLKFKDARGNEVYVDISSYPSSEGADQYYGEVDAFDRQKKLNPRKR
jgi:hypothetical protein